MALTDIQVRNLKPRDKAFKVADGGGLHVNVTPGGSKLWRLAYRFSGKQKLLAIGAYPVVTLEKAREARLNAKRQLSEGIDPSEAKKADKRAQRVATANTFEAIAAEYVEKLMKEGRSPRTLSKVEWLLGMAYPLIGRRPIAEISSAEVLEVLRKVERRGRHESARRLRSTIGSVFRYAIATTRAENDPSVALRGALITPKVTHRAAITDPKALGGLLRAVDGFDGQPTTRAALQLLALLFPRPGELRAAEWSEIDFEKAIWTIPAERAKMRREHRIPLPRQAIAILRRLEELTGDGALLFPSVRSAHRCMSENTLNAAMRRMGYSKEEVTAHGFRATASTLLNESGKWAPDVIERQLAHIDADEVRRAYARADYWDERVRMMAWWAGFLDKAKADGNVVPLSGQRESQLSQ